MQCTGSRWITGADRIGRQLDGVGIDRGEIALHCQTAFRITGSIVIEIAKNDGIEIPIVGAGQCTGAKNAIGIPGSIRSGESLPDQVKQASRGAGFFILAAEDIITFYRIIIIGGGVES